MEVKTMQAGTPETATNLPKWAIRLREIRETAGLSRADLARILGTSVNTIRRRELGENPPDAAEIQRIVEIFKARPDGFFDLSSITGGTPVEARS